jgi:long-chain fatty acid transport protein
MNETKERVVKRYIASALSYTLAVGMLHATNGDQMIATGTRSMGMGGAGLALSLGAESALMNPALLTKIEESELSTSLTLFFPSIETAAVGNDYSRSEADIYPIPSIVYAGRMGERVYGAVGVWGIAGMGVDFSDTKAGSALMKMQSNLMLMHISSPLAYRDDNGFSIGIAPILQLGVLDIEYSMMGIGGMKSSHPFDMELEAGFGARLGLTYDFDNGLTFAAVYRTPISMRYGNSGSGSDLLLEQPAEFGVGAAYRYGPHSFAFDIKRIEWNHAQGYEDFGWHGQNVYAAGYQYDAGRYSLRVGYNYARSAVRESRSHWRNYLNLLAFPATSERHFTAGFSYDISKESDIDFALVYSPLSKTGATIFEGDYIGDVDILNRHEELSFTIQWNHRF